MKNRGEKLLKFSGALFFIEGIIGVIAYGIMTLMLGVESIIEKFEAGAAVTGLALIIHSMYVSGAYTNQE